LPDASRTALVMRNTPVIANEVKQSMAEETLGCRATLAVTVDFFVRWGGFVVSTVNATHSRHCERSEAIQG